jgi:hypothetical protein
MLRGKTPRAAVNGRWIAIGREGMQFEAMGLPNKNHRGLRPGCSVWYDGPLTATEARDFKSSQGDAPYEAWNTGGGPSAMKPPRLSRRPWQPSSG